MSQFDLNGYAEIGGVDHGRAPAGEIDVKARITEEGNAFLKAEARSRGLTACEYAGELLRPAIEEARKESRADKERILKETLGDGWREIVKQLV